MFKGYITQPLHIMNKNKIGGTNKSQRDKKGRV